MQKDNFLKRKRDILSNVGCEIIKGQHILNLANKLKKKTFK
jgi:hypothetical protein